MIMFKITIVDLETGETEVDDVVNCIVGATSKQEKDAINSNMLGYISSSAITAADAIYHSELAKWELLKEQEILDCFFAIKNYYSEIEDAE